MERFWNLPVLMNKTLHENPLQGKKLIASAHAKSSWIRVFWTIILCQFYYY
jgi:hypothetical protein